MNNDLSLGDLCKFFEKQETQRICLPRLPVYARLDGRGFSRFTKKMGYKKPFDSELSEIMMSVMKSLVEEFDITVGYTQSDEISLAWVNRPIIFDGKIQKLVSSLASWASVVFNNLIRAPGNHGGKQEGRVADIGIPTFDCRVFQLPSEELCFKQFLWRELDCTKNAISGAAQEFFSHSQLMSKTGKEKQEMLFSKGVNFNDYPDYFKRGTFCIRRKVIKNLDPEILNKIPENKRPSEPIERMVVTNCILPPLLRILNPLDTLFRGAEPITLEEGKHT